MTDNNGLQPLAYSVRDAARVMSLGPTRIKQLIALGEIRASKVGRRLLVDAQSLRELLARAAK